MPKKIWIYPALSGVLMSLPWLINFPGIILAIAFVPLLLLNDYFLKNKFYSLRSIFLHYLLAFFIWQILSLWWVSNVTFIGALFAVSINSIFCTIVLWLNYLVGRNLGDRMGVIAFIFLWVAFEYISLHIEFALPWMVIGNMLSNMSKLIQWFEFTGVLGGSLWLLVLNIIAFKIVTYYQKRQMTLSGIYLMFFILFFVILSKISIIIYNQPVDYNKKIKVGIIQPNIDPFTEKFSTLTQEQQLQLILELADNLSKDSVQFYIAPETAIDNNIWEDTLWNNMSIFSIREFINVHPPSAFVIGAITKREYPKNEELSLTTRFDKQDSLYYEVFNSALYIDSSKNAQLYHKSKLVLGIEKTPFLKLFKFMGQFTIDLGGTDGSFGQQKHPSLLENVDTSVRIASVICYESVFGEHINGFINKGANVIFLITNDGWWGGSLGYLHHLNYARLRAIETRRSVVRCANTGISGIIDSYGNIVKHTNWWERTVLSGYATLNTNKTFYTRHGDYIGRIAIFVSICFLLILISVLLQNKK